MIKAEKKNIELTVEIHGKLPVLCLEMESLLRTFREKGEEALGKDGAEDLMNTIFDNSKKSLKDSALDDLKKRLDKDSQKAEINKTLDELLNIFKKAVEEEMEGKEHE